MFFTCEEVADLLKVKKETVWGWIRNGKLPAIRPTGKYLVAEQDLRRFMGASSEKG